MTQKVAEGLNGPVWCAHGFASSVSWFFSRKECSVQFMQCKHVAIEEKKGLLFFTGGSLELSLSLTISLLLCGIIQYVPNEKKKKKACPLPAKAHVMTDSLGKACGPIINTSLTRAISVCDLPGLCPLWPHTSGPVCQSKSPFTPLSVLSH